MDDPYRRVNIIGYQMNTIVLHTGPGDRQVINHEIYVVPDKIVGFYKFTDSLTRVTLINGGFFEVTETPEEIAEMLLLGGKEDECC